MNEHEPLNPDQQGAAGGSSSERNDIRAQRRRMIRNILVGAPAVIAASAGTAHASHGYGYHSLPAPKK